jgi:hypothetical protein
MTGEELDVAQAAARSMDIAGCDRDEAAPARMRRAALKAEIAKERGEPIDDAIRPKVRAARRADDRSDGCDPACNFDPLSWGSASKIDPLRPELLGCLLWVEAGGGGC